MIMNNVDFTISLYTSENIIFLDGSEKFLIKKDHQVIYCNEHNFELPIFGDKYEIKVSECIIRNFISSLKQNIGRFSFNTRKIGTIISSECFNTDIFKLAVKYTTFSNPTEIERHITQSLLFLVLSPFMKKADFIPFITCSINNKMTFKVKELIMRDVSKSWSLNMIAGILYVSSSSLKKRLKLEGTSYNKILVHCRMQYAKKLLKMNAHITILQLSTQCGYSSSSYFISAFKKYHGVTPYRFFSK